MRTVRAGSRKRDESAVLLQSMGTNLLTGGLIASNVVGQVGGAIQGWPMILAAKEADNQMVAMLGAGAFALVLVIAVVLMYAMRVDSGDDDDFDSESSYSESSYSSY